MEVFNPPPEHPQTWSGRLLSRESRNNTRDVDGVAVSSYLALERSAITWRYLGDVWCQNTSIAFHILSIFSRSYRTSRAPDFILAFNDFSGSRLQTLLN